MAALAACVLLAAGCGRIQHRTTGAAKPISYSTLLARPYTVIRHFEDSRRQVYLLFLNIPVHNANGVEIAESNLGEADGIVNLTLETHSDPLDWLVSLVTVGLVNTWDVEASGDLVRYVPRTGPAGP
ncbi:MAG: hypothetical protein M1457_14185 [bacterium]|nr:hypothetical protein [bacterium]